MATVAVSARPTLNGTKTYTGPFIGNGATTIIAPATARDLTAATTPAVTKVAEFRKALSGGVGTIDFTALPGETSEETVVGTGLAVIYTFLRNPSTNANNITITFGASSPLPLFGSTFVLTLKPGDEIGPIFQPAGPTIGSGAKNVDLSGTGVQALDCLFYLGTPTP